MLRTAHVRLADRITCATICGRSSNKLTSMRTALTKRCLLAVVGCCFCLGGLLRRLGLSACVFSGAGGFGAGGCSGSAVSVVRSTGAPSAAWHRVLVLSTGAAAASRAGDQAPLADRLVADRTFPDLIARIAGSRHVNNRCIALPGSGRGPDVRPCRGEDPGRVGRRHHRPAVPADGPADPRRPCA